jgi:hypothetical protein
MVTLSSFLTHMPLLFQGLFQLEKKWSPRCRTKRFTINVPRGLASEPFELVTFKSKRRVVHTKEYHGLCGSPAIHERSTKFLPFNSKGLLESCCCTATAPGVPSEQLVELG